MALSFYLQNILNVTQYTVKLLNVGTDRAEQTVQTQIRLLLKEQSDQGLHYLPFHLDPLDALLHCKITVSFSEQLW